MTDRPVAQRGLARVHMMVATGLLSAVIVAACTYAVLSTAEISSENEWRTTVDELSLLYDEIDDYQSTHGELPGSLKQLFDGRIPVDPWGNPYVYRQRGDTFTVYSLGSDGEPNTIEDVHLHM